MEDGGEPAPALLRIRNFEPAPGFPDRMLGPADPLAQRGSGDEEALAISAVVSPPTALRVSASCAGGDSTGWQQRNSRARTS